MNTFWLFDCPSIGDIREVVDRKLKRARIAPSSSSKKSATGGRHVKWKHGNEYVCIREGVEIESTTVLDQLHKTKKLQEHMFYIFRNIDRNVTRNQEVPLYEAVYKCNGVYLKVQKCHLKQAYMNSGRTDTSRMWTIQADGVPYHVDRYAYCKQSQLNSKKRYEKKIKTSP